MKNTVLITGGAGFIGSHVANELIQHGYRVRVLDVLAPQVHGEEGVRPTFLNSEVELVRGDIRDIRTVDRALKGVNSVFHFVALVGVGQSMYQIQQYTSVNNLGTALLLKRLVKKPIEKLIVASSMSVYREGLYRTADGLLCTNVNRTIEQLRRRQWDSVSDDGESLIPMPTPE
jgi:dTDP-L-rhamnose 4-epimerase